VVQYHPGALVLEVGSSRFSSIIRLVGTESAVVRHVGGCDDHTVALASLQGLSTKVLVGGDANDSPRPPAR
jgi:hypothetical protein